MSPPLPDSNWKQRFRRRLRSWFRRHARRLPWRRTSDPYRVWVSEIMLQQTQVATVIPYYERFIATFPNVRALAGASEDQVLRLWEGLGYYRRARQMHTAAKMIVSEHGGRVPADLETLRALPGIGRYTAGAILSIATDAREPILEANTTRLLSRLLAYRQDPTRSAGQRLLWRLAEELLPRKDVGEFNQALMELGSRICTPRDPACGDCPVATLCAARQTGLQSVLPVPKKRRGYEDTHEACVVVWRNGEVLLRRCGDGERWAGLWDFPRFPIRARRGEALRKELAKNVARLTGATVEPGRRLATIRHGVTRFRITLACYEARYVQGQATNGEIRWLQPSELENYPLSATGRKIGQRLRT